MPSHIIVGASRGIGFGFLQQLSKDPSNTVIGLVRNTEATQKRVDAEGLKNVTILQADITDYNSVRAAASKVSSLVPNGAVDYLWNNAAYISHATANRFFDEFTPEEWPQLLEELQTSWSTNVVGIINTINAFIPLVLKSSIKKVITISTGMADDKLTSQFEVWEGAPYSASKAAVNMIVAKWDARYRSKGVLFLAISPGVVYHGQEGTHVQIGASRLMPPPIVPSMLTHFPCHRRSQSRACWEILQIQPEHEWADQSRTVNHGDAQDGLRL